MWLLLLLLLHCATCQAAAPPRTTVPALGQDTTEAVLCSTSPLPGCERFQALYQQQQQHEQQQQQQQRLRLHELGSANGRRRGLQHGRQQQQQQRGEHQHAQHGQHGSDGAATAPAGTRPPAPCKRLLWFVAYYSPDLDKGYAENVKVAVLSARQNAPSLIPHAVVDGPRGGELETWLRRAGVQVLHHELTIFPQLAAAVAAGHIDKEVTNLRGTFLRLDVPALFPAAAARYAGDPAVDTAHFLYTDLDVVLLRDVDSCALGLDERREGQGGGGGGAAEEGEGLVAPTLREGGGTPLAQQLRGGGARLEVQPIAYDTGEGGAAGQPKPAEEGGASSPLLPSAPYALAPELFRSQREPALNAGVMLAHAGALAAAMPRILAFAAARDWRFAQNDQSLLNEWPAEAGLEIPMLPDELNWKGYWGGGANDQQPPVAIFHLHGPKPGRCLDCYVQRRHSFKGGDCGCPPVYDQLYGWGLSADGGEMYDDVYRMYRGFLQDIAPGGDDTPDRQKQDGGAA